MAEWFFTDHMFVDITAPTLGASSRLYEMTVDNTDLQQEIIYLYSISGDELFDGNTPSAQYIIDFVADVETNGTYALADLQRATPSEAPLATTTVITDMPTNIYEWADDYYHYLWNPFNDSRVSAGSVNLTISANELIAGKTWALFPPTHIAFAGHLEIPEYIRFDTWVDTNTDDFFFQLFDPDNSVAGTLRILDWATYFPAVNQVSDYWDLAYHPLNTTDFLTEIGLISSSVELFPYTDASQLPDPIAVEDNRGYYAFASFRNMSNFDSSTGTATFANESRTYTGGAFDSNFQSEPGDTTYINSGSYDRDKFWPSDIRYDNAPSAIKVNFTTDIVLDDGWGFSDNFSGFYEHYIQGSVFGDEFFGLDSESSLNGFSGNDWIHSFTEGGAWMDLGIGADFVDASDITSTTPGRDLVVDVVVNADGIWDGGYYAFNASDANHVGTGDLASLNGYRQIQDVIFGSADGDIRIDIEDANDFSNTENKGIALFSDDIFAGRHAEAGQITDTRLKDIAEIHTTRLDDIIDLTSSYHADQTGNVKVYGLAGDDILWGGSSNETLDVGNGADLINGGAGDDTLTGGSGADIFEFTATSGNDTITDYNQGEGDVLRFFRRSADTNTPFIDEANDQVTWQADGHTVTIDFNTDITTSNVTIQYDFI
ncbi:hypothetical protein N9J36_00030 [Litoricola sp.]|nr:hypothetical protein [Litorivicinus sp.]